MKKVLVLMILIVLLIGLVACDTDGAKYYSSVHHIKVINSQGEIIINESTSKSWGATWPHIDNGVLNWIAPGNKKMTYKLQPGDRFIGE